MAERPSMERGLGRAMRSRVRVAGHPLHPMLVMFPTAIFPLLLVLDLVPRFVETDAGFAAAGFWLAAAGFVTTLLAIVPGTVDMMRIPDGTRAHRTGAVHAVLGVATLVAYGVAAWARWPPGLERVGLNLGIDVAGILLVSAQGYLGAELVYRHHVGVKTPEEGGEPTALTGPR